MLLFGRAIKKKPQTLLAINMPVHGYRFSHWNTVWKTKFTISTNIVPDKLGVDIRFSMDSNCYLNVKWKKYGKK